MCPSPRLGSWRRCAVPFLVLPPATCLCLGTLCCTAQGLAHVSAGSAHTTRHWRSCTPHESTGQGFGGLHVACSERQLTNKADSGDRGGEEVHWLAGCAARYLSFPMIFGMRCSVPTSAARPSSTSCHHNHKPHSEAVSHVPLRARPHTATATRRRRAAHSNSYTQTQSRTQQQLHRDAEPYTQPHTATATATQ